MRDQITINAAAVGLPAKAAASVTADAIAGCFEMMEGRELNIPKPLAGQTFTVQLGMPALRPSDRRELYETWLVTKGFHDLFKGLRTSFERAYLYIALLHQRQIAGKDIAAFVQSMEMKAERLHFVPLVDQVSRKLKSPLSYYEELLSLQKTRNCLEHRNGIVGMADVSAQERVLSLRFPRLKAFYTRAGHEVEVGPGAIIDTGDERAEVEIFIKRETYERHFALGDHVRLSSAEFIEVAMATCLIADDLVSKLPVTSAPAP